MARVGGVVNVLENVAAVEGVFEDLPCSVVGWFGPFAGFARLETSAVHLGFYHGRNEDVVEPEAAKGKCFFRRREVWAPGGKAGEFSEGRRVVEQAFVDFVADIVLAKFDVDVDNGERNGDGDLLGDAKGNETEESEDHVDGVGGFPSSDGDYEYPRGDAPGEFLKSFIAHSYHFYSLIAAQHVFDNAFITRDSPVVKTKIFHAVAEFLESFPVQ